MRIHPLPTFALALTAVAALQGAAATAAPVVITTADGRGADNQVMGYGNDRETLNKGKAGNLEVRGHEFSGNNFYGVLRFDLSPLEPGVDRMPVTLTLTVIGNETGPGTISVFGLKDGFAGGPDDSGQAERGEADYAEGDLNFKAPTAADQLTGDNAPGLREKMPRLAALAFLNSPFTLLGTVDVPADLKAGQTLTLTSEPLAEFLQQDTNGVAVLYLATETAFVQLGTKESQNPASLTVGE